jgi:hypothetical protein
VAQDLPKDPFFDGIEPDPEVSAETGDPRLANIIQQMASFGVKSGEANWRERGVSSAAHFEYYA